MNIVFLFNAESRDYQRVITDYKKKLGPARALAFVKCKDNTKSLLPPVIDFLYENDIKPMPFEIDKAVQMRNEQFHDVAKVFDNSLLHQDPYTFFVTSDRLVNVKQGNLTDCLNIAAQLLHGNKEVLSVDFQPEFTFGSQRLNDLYSRVDGFTLSPAVVRTRDFWIATQLSLNHQNQTFPVVFNQMFGALSNSQLRYLSFNREIATS